MKSSRRVLNARMIFFTTHIFNSILKLSLLFGFIVVAFYFISISFVPVGDLRSLIYILLVIAMIGGMILFSLITTFIFAPMSWLELLQMKDTGEYITKKHAEYCLDAYKSGYIDVPKEITFRIMLFYGLPILSYILLIEAVGYFKSNFWASLLLFFGLISCVLSKFILLLNERVIENLFFAKCLHRVWIWLKIVIFSSAAGFILVGGNLLIINMIYSHLQSNDSFVEYILLPLIIVFSSSLCLLPPNNKFNIYRWMLVVGAGSILFLFVFLGVCTEAFTMLVRSLQLGAISNATIIVDNVGCQVISLNKIAVNCKNKEFNVIDNVNILWRAGEYYISMKEKDGTQRRLTIPAEHVPSFSVGGKKASSDKASLS